MLILDKNFQPIGGFGVCCFPEDGDNVLEKCSKHVKGCGAMPQVVYLRSETSSDKKWLGSNTEKFYFDGYKIVEIDEY